MKWESNLSPPIPDYELLRPIGRGAYGEVWLARGVTGVLRAIKVVWRNRFRDTDPFDREFRGLKRFAAVSLQEPRQLAVLHVGRDESDHFFYYVMELADDARDGTNIRPITYVPRTLRPAGEPLARLPAAEVVQLGIDLGEALGVLHRCGLVHRDIKPSNVIYVAGVPKLADIGLIAETDSTQSFVGTQGYVPPEGPGTPSADLYALGKLLYELSTGLDRCAWPRLPENVALFDDRPAFFELQEVIDRACSIDPNRRYRDAGAFLADLRLLQAGGSLVDARRGARRERALRRVGAILLLLALVATAGWWTQRRLARRAEAQRESLAERNYRSTLANAQAQLVLARLGRARQFLDQLRPDGHDRDRRGPEWWALWLEAQGDPTRWTRDVGEGIIQVSADADGSRLAAQTRSGLLHLHTPPAAKAVLVLNRVRDLGGFDGDGTLWWTEGDDRSLRCLPPGAATPTETGIRSNLLLHAFAGGHGGLLLRNLLHTSDAQPSVLTWYPGAHRGTGREWTLPADPDHPDVWHAASADSRPVLALVRGGGPGRDVRRQLEWWDIDQGRRLQVSPLDRSPQALALSRDGAWVALGFSEGGEVALYRAEAASPSKRWTAHSGTVTALAFSPDGAWLATAADNRELRRWHLPDAAPAGRRIGHAQALTTLAWTLDGHAIVSADNAGGVRLWDFDAPDLPSRLDGFWHDQGGDLAVSATGLFAATAANGNIRLGTTETRTVEEPDLADGFEPLAFLDEDRVLLLLNRDGLVESREIHGDRRLRAYGRLFEGRSEPERAVVSTPAKRLAAIGSNGHFEVRDLSTWTVLHGERWDDRLLAVALTRDGSRVAVAGRQGEVRERPLGASSTPVSQAIAVGDVVDQLAWAPDGRHLVASLEGGPLVVLAPNPLREVRRIPMPAEMFALDFSPDGTRLAAGGRGGALVWIETERWTEIVTLESAITTSTDDETLFQLRFDAGGRNLVGFTSGGSLRFWRTSP